MRHTLSQRLITLLLLMAYTITGTSVLPATLAIVAVMDDSHQVIIGQSQAGITLTLHHRAGEYTPYVADHRRTLTRMLVSLFRSPKRGDHQMASARLAGTVKNEDTPICKIRSVRDLVDLTATQLWCLSLRLLHISAAQPVEHHPDRSDDSRPLGSCKMARSVQMLI